MPADVKFMANKRLTIAVALASGNPFVNPAAPTVTEANALKNVSPATRINGYSFGMQASPQTDDRSFADEPSAQNRGFNQFGGDVPLYLPTDYTDTSDLLQQVFTLVKTPGVALWVMTRLGPLNNSVFAAGDFVNVYKVLTDGIQANVEGTNGGVVVVTFLPQGDVYPLVVLAPAAPVAVTVTGYPAAPTIGKPIFGTATYQSRNVTGEVTWSSTDTTKLIHTGHGIFLPLAAGPASIVASYPGATASTPFVTTTA